MIPTRLIFLRFSQNLMRIRLRSQTPSPLDSVPDITSKIINLAVKSDEELSYQEQKRLIPHWVRTPVDMSILNAESIKDLLSVANSVNLDGNQSVSFLVKLAKFQALRDAENFKEEPIFQRSLDAIRAEYKSFNTGTLTLALRNLLQLGVQDNNLELIQKLQEQFTTNAHKCNISTLISLAVFHVPYASLTKAGSTLQQTLEQLVGERILEVSTPEDLFPLMTKLPSQHFLGSVDKSSFLASAADWSNLVESRASEIVADMKPESVCKLFAALSEARSRNVPLLRLGAEQISRFSEPLTKKQCLSLLNSAKTLNFYQPMFLNRLCKELLPNVENMEKLREISTVLTQLILLRVENSELIGKLCQWIKKRLMEGDDSLQPTELAYIVVGLARRNFHEASDLVELIRDRLSVEGVLGVQEGAQAWLDFVWALACLRALTQTQLDFLLTHEQTWRSLVGLDGNNVEFRQLMNRMKLRNIEGAAEFDLELPFSLPDSLKQIPDSALKHMGKYKKMSKLFSGLINYVAKRDTSSKLCFFNQHGAFIDAELGLEPGGDPIHRSKWDGVDPKLMEGTFGKGSKRVVFLLWDFSDYAQPEKKLLTGVHEMGLRHLKLQGYTVVQVEWADVMKRRTFQNKLDYIKELLKKAE